MKHFGDPCIHCGIPHDDVPVGPCQGDYDKARVLEYCVSRSAWQNPGSGCDTILCAMSAGDVRTETRHPAEHWWNNDWFKGAKVLAPHEFKQRYHRFLNDGPVSAINAVRGDLREIMRIGQLTKTSDSPNG